MFGKTNWLMVLFPDLSSPIVPHLASIEKMNHCLNLSPPSLSYSFSVSLCCSVYLLVQLFFCVKNEKKMGKPERCGFPDEKNVYPLRIFLNKPLYLKCTIVPH